MKNADSEEAYVVKEHIVEERTTKYGRRIVKSLKGRIRVEKQVAEEKEQE